MDAPKHRLRQAGFHLVEVLVTLAILAVLTAMAAPDFADMIRAQRLASITNDVLQQLHLARSEAIKRNTRVALCKSDDGAACSVDGPWDRGWILFEDGNNSGTREPDEALLQRLLPIPPDYRLTGNAPLARYVSYGPLGQARMTSNAFQAGTFTLCRASLDPAEGRQIIVNSGGRPRVQKVQLAECV